MNRTINRNRAIFTTPATPFPYATTPPPLLLNRLLLSLLLHLLGSLGIASISQSRNNLLDGINSAGRAARLGQDDFAGFIDDKDAALGALGRFLQPDGGDQRRVRVAEERVGQLLLVLEGGVGLGGVGG